MTVLKSEFCVLHENDQTFYSICIGCREIAINKVAKVLVDTLLYPYLSGQHVPLCSGNKGPQWLFFVIFTLTLSNILLIFFQGSVNKHITKTQLARLEGKSEKEQVEGLRAWYQMVNKDANQKKLKICEAVGLKGIPSLFFIVALIYWSYGLAGYFNPQF